MRFETICWLTNWTDYDWILFKWVIHNIFSLHFDIKYQKKKKWIKRWEKKRRKREEKNISKTLGTNAIKQVHFERFRYTKNTVVNVIKMFLSRIMNHMIITNKIDRICKLSTKYVGFVVFILIFISFKIKKTIEKLTENEMQAIIRFSTFDTLHFFRNTHTNTNKHIQHNI